MTIAAGIILLLLSILAAGVAYETLIGIPHRLDNPATAEDEEAHRQLENIRNWSGRRERLQTIGVGISCLGIIFLAGAIWLLTGQSGNGSGIRIGIMLSGFLFLVVSGATLFTASHPLFRGLIEREGKKPEKIRMLCWWLGGIGLLVIAVGCLVR